MFPQLHSNADAATMTNLVDVAAAVETRLRNAEARAQTLQRDLLHLQRRHESARRWITAIRKCHRTRSHAGTTRVIRAALASLDAGHSININPSLF